MGRGASGEGRRTAGMGRGVKKVGRKAGWRFGSSRESFYICKDKVQ